jgi:hypothetical protein
MKIGGIIFGGIFFLAGLAVFSFAVLDNVYDAIEMQSWEPTPAELKRSEMHSYESRNDNGSYTTMYSVDIEYEYISGGKIYTGTRADIHDNSTSNRSKHSQRLYELEQEAKRNQFKVWVNPNDPSESVYDRTLDLKFTLTMALFSSTFMLVGGGIMYLSRKKDKKLPSRMASDPTQLWTTRPEWASSTVYSNAKSKIGIIGFFTILLTLFLGTFSLALFGEHPVATTFSFLLWLPPIFMFRWYRRVKREWTFFDKVPLQLRPYPGVIGGTVAGSIAIPCAYTKGDHYTFELKCTHHWQTRSGNETKNRSSVVWSKEITPKPIPKIKSTYLTFDFDVPADQPSSSVPDNNYHSWTLSITSELKGINFNREYEIPVFVTRDSQSVEDELIQQPLSAQQKAEIHARLSVNQPSDTHDESAPIPSAFYNTGQALTMHTPGSSTGWFIAGFGLVFFIIGALIGTYSDAIFGVIFSSFATVFILIGILVVGKNNHIRVKPNQLDVDVFIFSKLINQHKLTQQDIKDIQPQVTSSASHNGKQISKKYSLILLTTDGKRIDLGGEFESMKNATHMQNEIEAVLAG